jgi:DNA-binding FrmR family transcriptional regulator
MRHFTDKRPLLNALSRLEGQIRGIRAMVDDERDCPEIIQQISAARSALDVLGVRLVADNLRACMESHAIPEIDKVRMEQAFTALGRLR